MFTTHHTSASLNRLEQLHTMLTLDEAVEILTGRRPSLLRRVRKKAVNFWRDISLAAGAPFRKVIDVIDGKVMYPVDELELFLRRHRRFGFIEQLGLEVPYYDFEDGETRLISTDLLATLKGEPPLAIPGLHRGTTQGRSSVGRRPERRQPLTANRFPASQRDSIPFAARQ